MNRQKTRHNLTHFTLHSAVHDSYRSVYALLLSSFVGTERSEVERRREGKEERRDRAERSES